MPQAGRVSTWKDRLARASPVPAENSDTPGRLDAGCVPPTLFSFYFRLKNNERELTPRSVGKAPALNIYDVKEAAMLLRSFACRARRKYNLIHCRWKGKEFAYGATTCRGFFPGINTAELPYATLRIIGQFSRSHYSNYTLNNNGSSYILNNKEGDSFSRDLFFPVSPWFIYVKSIMMNFRCCSMLPNVISLRNPTKLYSNLRCKYMMRPIRFPR